jgi:hypothetical protein
MTTDLATAAPPHSWRTRLIERIRETPHCDVAAAPVGFGQRGWLAQHRWLEPAIGLLLLLPVGALFVISAEAVGRPTEIALGVVWAGFVGVGIALRQLRPCAVLRFPAYALVVWLGLVLLSTR